ncbi:hypothetical protein BAE46_13875 [Glaciecola punicea]|uniref:hypothetical protein n=1 Tax=Glaciecola punicea TaxID=56804 RepID=UPI0008722E08|nr:hypothetical protein [Glaciecola punicea]OFA29770.1 hypothetical protein BAE46_13875 [Glaciecola punicea]
MDSAKQHVQKYSQPSKESSIISNNLIIHTATSHPFADVGIGIESSPPRQWLQTISFLQRETTQTQLNIGLTEPLVCLSKKISPINLLPTEIAGAATQKDNGTGGKPKQVANSIQYLPKSQE